jgi:two-component system, cell cycle response regulator
MEEHYLYYLDKSLKLAKGRQYVIGRSGEAEIKLPDERVSRRHAALKWSGTGFSLVDLQSTNGTYVNGGKAGSIRLLDGDKIRIGPHDLQYVIRSGSHESVPGPDDTLIFERKIHELAEGSDNPETAGKIRELKRYYNQKRDSLSDMAFRDQLTGLFNRRYFDQKLQEEVDRSARYGRPLSLVMGDIDQFKGYNDDFGHQKGDEVLRTVADLLKASCRSSDVAARYGGEEMVLILPETDAEGALRVAEKARKIIEARAGDAADRTVTISMGITSFGPGADGPAELIAAADRALYKAKNEGRNRCVLDRGIDSDVG